MAEQLVDRNVIAPAAGQSFKIRFASRFSIFDRNTAQTNTLRLVGAGAITFAFDHVRIVGRRWRGFGVTAPVDLKSATVQIINLQRRAERISFEVRSADGVILFLGFRATNESEARSIVAGLPDISTASFSKHLAEMSEFGDRLQTISPTAWVTPAIVLANVIVFALLAFNGAGIIKPDSAVMLRWGANYGPLTSDGEWWRLGSSMFMHFGLLHLALNMWALYSSGQLVERLFGSARFLTLYVVAGLAGSIASVLWNPNTISAGASGAIFGVFGALLAFMLKPQNRIPAAIMSGHTRSTLAFVGYNLVFGATQTGIDNAAHLGGLAGGAIMGLALARPFDVEIRRKAGVLSFLLALLAAVALLGATSWPITHPSIAKQNAQAFRRGLMWFESHEGPATDRFNQFVKQLNQKDTDEAVIAKQIALEIVPLWDDMHAHVASADLSSDAHLQALQRAYLDYIDHRRRGMALISSGIDQGDREQVNAGEALMKQGDADIEVIKNLRKPKD